MSKSAAAAEQPPLTRAVGYEFVCSPDTVFQPFVAYCEGDDITIIYRAQVNQISL